MSVFVSLAPDPASAIVVQPRGIERFAIAVCDITIALGQLHVAYAMSALFRFALEAIRRATEVRLRAYGAW